MSAEAPSRRLFVLGSTGSIGVNALDVVDQLKAHGLLRFTVVGLAAGNNAALLAEQAARFGVEAVALAAGGKGAAAVSAGGRSFVGPDGAREMIDAMARPGDLVLGAVVGSDGIPAILAAIDRRCDIALANKETLVAAGELVMRRVREKDVHLLPVDSEHSAISQCLRSGRSINEVRRLILTASGGPFRTWSKQRMINATVEEALEHPTWNMGRKITVDSASMMNKALEVVEAHWLFGLPAEQIDVLVHPQSIVHSFVEFVDGSVVAQLGEPDMRTPIQYALTWPDRLDCCHEPLDFDSLRRMEFEPVDDERFPAVALADEVIRAEGTAGAIFNAANEAAVEAFLEKRIPFGRISKLVEGALSSVSSSPIRDLDDVLEADHESRDWVRAHEALTTETQRHRETQRERQRAGNPSGET